MGMMRHAFLAAAIVVICGSAGFAAKIDTVRIGYLEAGEYYQHVPIRNLFVSSLEHVLAGTHHVQYATHGIRSTGWKRDSCRTAARQLARNSSLDLIFAIGPWVVQDLIDAGCTVPIVAALQPTATSPWRNRTARPPILYIDSRQKIERDMALIQRLVNPKRVAVLGFTDQGTASPLVEAVRQTRPAAAWDVVTASEYDNFGTFAFLKAYQTLPKDVDAIYIGPLWRMDISNLDEFLAAARRDRKPVLSFDPTLVERGAVASTAYGWGPASALFHAHQAAQLLTGTSTANIPTSFQPSTYSLVNLQAARTSGVRIPEGMLIADMMVGQLDRSDVPVLSLADAIYRTLEGNPTMAMARATAEQALTVYSEQSAGFLPRVTAFGEVARIDDNTVDAHGGRLQNGLFGAGVAIDQTVFSWTALQELKTRKSLQAAGEHTIDDARQLLSQAVVEVYAALLNSQRRLEHLQEYRQRIDELLQMALAREAAGSARSDEFLRWDARRWQAAAEQARLNQQLYGARVMLNALLNQPLNESVAIDSAYLSGDLALREAAQLLPTSRDSQWNALSVDKILTAARKQHPQLRSIEERLESQSRWQDASIGRWLPTVGVRAELGISDSLQSAAELSEENPRWKLGLNFTLPLFDPAIKKGNRLSSQKLLWVESRRDSLDLAIQSAVYMEYRALFNNSTRLLALFEATRQQRAALPELVAQYAGSRITMGDIDRDLAALYDMQVERSAALGQYFNAEVRLLRAAGVPLNEVRGSFGSTLLELAKE